MEEILKIIDKHLADDLLDSYNPIRLLETIRAEIVNLGQFEQQVKPTLAELNRYTNRIVVVDHRQGSSDYGRTIDAWHVKLEFDWQDYGKTLKIFINDR